MSIAVGATSTTFNIDVTTVDRNTLVTVTATYSGATKTGNFTVTPPPLEPRFTVVSLTKGNDACAIDQEDGHLDCEFDGRPSTGSIALWHWELTVRRGTYEFESHYWAHEPDAQLRPNG